MMIMVLQYWFFKGYNLCFKYFFSYDIWFDRNMIKALIVTVVTCAFICFGVQFYRNLAKKNPVLRIVGNLTGIR